MYVDEYRDNKQSFRKSLPGSSNINFHAIGRMLHGLMLRPLKATIRGFQQFAYLPPEDDFFHHRSNDDHSRKVKPI